MLALNGTARGAFRLNGNPTIDANCGLMSNSGHGWGFEIDGHPTVEATYVGVVGGFRQNGNSASITANLLEGAVAASDPFAKLPMPDYSGWAPGSFDKNSGQVTCPGGHCVFYDELKISGPKQDVHFPPGEYALLDGMQINSNKPVNGSEVFFFTSGSKGVGIASNGTVTFTPPTSGTYKGILFFGDRNVSGVENKFGRGTADFQCRGVLYYPTQEIDFAGTFIGQTKWGMLIADKLQFHGNTDYIVLNQPPADEAPEMGTVMLAE